MANAIKTNDLLNFCIFHGPPALLDISKIIVKVWRFEQGPVTPKKPTTI